jgi:hypothetical protein
MGTAKQTPMAEAVRLQAALDKINTREQKTLANTMERYQAERNALTEAASPAALRILAAADSEVAG